MISCRLYVFTRKNFFNFKKGKRFDENQYFFCLVLSLTGLGISAFALWAEMKVMVAYSWILSSQKLRVVYYIDFSINTCKRGEGIKTFCSRGKS